MSIETSRRLMAELVERLVADVEAPSELRDLALKNATDALREPDGSPRNRAETALAAMRTAELDVATKGRKVALVNDALRGLVILSDLRGSGTSGPLMSVVLVKNAPEKESSD